MFKVFLNSIVVILFIEGVVFVTVLLIALIKTVLCNGNL
jgi:hypothetical protein